MFPWLLNICTDVIMKDLNRRIVKRGIALKKVLAASDEENKESCTEAYRQEKRKIKR